MLLGEHMMPMGCGGMWGSQLVVLNEVWGGKCPAWSPW